jgi:hypothetical protein
VAIAEATPYVILRLDWLDVAANYMDVLVKAFADINTDDLIVGKANYSAGILQDTFDYTKRSITVLSQNSGIGNFHYSDTDPTGTQRLNYEGWFYATKVFNPVFGDIAEFIEKDPDDLSLPGMVLVQSDKGLRHSYKRADRCAIGVYSDSFGYALACRDQYRKYPVGLSGVIKVLIKTPVVIGDFLVSDEDGYATAATKSDWEYNPHAIIGKALENHTNYQSTRIKMLIK